jgi:hypothetical protein
MGRSSNRLNETRRSVPDKPEGRRSLLGKANSFIYSKTWRERKKKKKQEAEKAEEGSSVDERIVLNRDLSRRQRNLFLKGGSSTNLTANVTAYLSARVEAEKPVVADVYDHSSAISRALMKPHMLDVKLKGADGEIIPANSFILGCYSPVLEEAFFKKKKFAMYDEKKQKLNVDFCNGSVLKAAVHHCFTGELPSDFNVSDNTEEIARDLAQLGRFASTFHMRALGEVSYRAARKLINRRAVLACAIFDELFSLDNAAGFDSIKGYALDTIREMPMDTLLGGGVQWMSENSVECIMQDQDMDVDEFYMFKILNAWEQGAERVENRVSKARKMAENIELKFIAVELIKSQIRGSGYFEEENIRASIRAIEETLASRDPHEMERVIVEGAGLAHVNGIYVRVLEELGMAEEDILFVKEADDGISDVGLYLYNEKWTIAMCTDYSNCFYRCPDNTSRQVSELVPRNGWTTSYGGQDPAPTCTYLPNTRSVRSSQTTVLAPNLEEMIDPTIAQKRRSGFFDKSIDDTIEKRTMTLEQMMNLPEDRENINTPTEPNHNASDESFGG